MHQPRYFQALEARESAQGACARAIRTAILSGEIPPGARLPPERELAKAFRVNRVTVRSALGQLEARRLITVRQGSGCVVRDYRRDAGPDLLPAIGRIAEEGGELGPLARDLLHVRRHLARAVLESLARVADPKGIAAIGAAVEQFAAVAREGASPERVAEADVAVVAAMLDATRSPVLQLCLNPVLVVLQELPALRDAMYREPEDNAVGWRALVAWLETRDTGMIGAIIGQLEVRDELTLRALARAGRATGRRTKSKARR